MVLLEDEDDEDGVAEFRRDSVSVRLDFVERLNEEEDDEEEEAGLVPVFGSVVSFAFCFIRSIHERGSEWAVAAFEEEEGEEGDDDDDDDADADEDEDDEEDDEVELGA